jgi:fucose 4-O-acetylase-like acetyltransferase
MSSVKTGIQNWIAKAYNTSILKEKRLEWGDYLRGLAILLVIYRHVLIGLQRSHMFVPQGLIDANMIFYSFRMPLFFILSGIFISKSLAKHSVKKLAGIKFELLIYPYLIWTIIQITLQILLSNFTNSDRTWIDYSYIFYQPRSLDQFWYLPALFNTTMIYVLLKTKLNVKPGAQLLIGIVLYFLSPYFQEVSMISDWMSFYFFFAIGDAISGFILKDSTQDFFKNPYALLLVIPIFILSQQYYFQHNFSNFAIAERATLSSHDYVRHIRDQIDFLFVAFTGCLAMYILAFQLQNWKKLRFLRIIGYHSLYIYVMHVIVTACVRLALVRICHITNPYLILLISIALGVAVPIAFYNLFIRKHALYFLFTYKKKKPKSVQPKTVRPTVIAPQATN